MNSPKHTFARTFPVTTDHVDWEKKLSIPGLFLFLQEVAWEHANTWNFGYKQLNEKGQFWVLSKLKVEIDHYPQWNEELNLHTWGKEPEVLTAYRDYIGYDSDNQPYFKATSAWHILSMATGRPQRVDVMKEHCPIPEGYHAIEAQPAKLPSPLAEPVTRHSSQACCECNEAITRHLDVVLSDIDMNMHVNNTRYIQWVLDSFLPEFAMSHKIKEIEVNFLQQAKLGDQYYIATQELSDNTFLSAAIRLSDNKELVRVQTVWF